jgi:hypothetical protein
LVDSDGVAVVVADGSSAARQAPVVQLLEQSLLTTFDDLFVGLESCVVASREIHSGEA